MDPHASLLVYKALAEHYERAGPAAMRDRFLVLSADSARAAGLDDEAERLRTQLLQLNPHHLLRPFRSFAQAMETPDVQTYVRDLRQSYPPSKAEALLRDVRGDESPKPRAEAKPRAEGQSPPVVTPVYSVRDEPPRAAAPAAEPAQPARPAARPTPVAARPPRTLPAHPAAPPAANTEPAPASFLPSLLFGLMFVISLLLVAYTLGRPFLPTEWLP
jgi:hypothetical protein